MPIRIMASRHSAFYSPLLCCIRFLRDEGREVTYSVLGADQRTYALIRDGAVDIVQSAVSSNWKPRERGVEPLPVHFAQINQRDGFFLVGRHPEPVFDWKKLEGKTLLADHGLQPLVMLKYAVRHNGADWKKIKVIDADFSKRLTAYIAKDHRAGSPRLFTSLRGASVALDREAVKSILDRVGQGAAVHCHAHKFRHTFASRAIADGVDPIPLQRVLGHTTLEMVARYVHYSAADLLDAWTVRRSRAPFPR